MFPPCHYDNIIPLILANTPLANGYYLVYTVENSILVGRWTSWNNLVSPNVRSARRETWCPYPILAVKGQIFITKPGFALIPIAAST